MAEIQDLIDVIQKSNSDSDARLHTVEEHTRNSRRHLLEMKKETFKISEGIAAIAAVQPAEPPEPVNEGADEESRREQKMFQEKQQATLEKIAGGLSGQKESSAAGSKKGMGLKGLLGAAVGLGIVAVIGAVAAAIAAIANIDFTKMKENIMSLLSISEELGGTGKMFLEGGTFFLVMTGIGIGLGVFAAGSAAAKAADLFEREGWTDRIKQNVKNLLSISDELGGNTDLLLKGGTFFLAMTGIGAGLAVFGGGAAIAGLSDGLLSFMDPGWAQGIVDNVKILLSISEIPLKDTAMFVATMGGIGAGLVAFGAGAGFAGIISYFLGDEIPKIKKNALDLVSITDAMGSDPVAKSEAFRTSMTNLGAGLSSFAGGNFGAALKNLGASILDFFSGGESPIDSVMRVADKADDLDKGTNAIQKLADALEKISTFKFDGGKLGLEDLANDLLKSIPAIETAINGGVVGEGWFSSGEKIKGLASGDIKFDEAAKSMQLLKEATVDFREAQMAMMAPAAGGGGNVTNITNSSNPQSTVSMNTPLRSRSSFVPEGL